MSGLRRRVAARRARGQSLVEFSMILPIFLLILLGLLEFGFAFDHLMTLSYATREGARTGAALADGSELPLCSDVDKYVIAAVERVLTSDGSPINDSIGRVSSIRIYKANDTGGQIGSSVNVWVPGNGPTVDGRQLHFNLSGGGGWSACGRTNAVVNPDSIGIQISYTYDAVTPLSALMQMIGGSGAGSLPMTDRSVMALNPTD